MLIYPYVYTNLSFVSICTITLEVRVVNNINLDAETNHDGFFATFISDQVCSNKEDLQNWRQRSANKRFVVHYLQHSVLYVDKGTQFYFRNT